MLSFIRSELVTKDNLHQCTGHHCKVRCISMYVPSGGDLSLLLPPCEELVQSRSLAALVSHPRALYLLKYGYETLYAAGMEEGD